MHDDDRRRRKVVAWVTANVLPHEGRLRGWLSRARLGREDIDDIVQESYCRLAALDDVETIERPDAYFFSVARNLLIARFRRQRVVRIDAVADIEAFAPADEAPSPERAASARIEMAQVRALVDNLPERCRTIFELRKIEGLSQKEIAARLGVSESVVENDTAKGLRLVLQALKARAESSSDSVDTTSSESAA